MGFLSFLRNYDTSGNMQPFVNRAPCGAQGKLHKYMHRLTYDISLAAPAYRKPAGRPDAEAEWAEKREGGATRNNAKSRQRRQQNVPLDPQSKKGQEHVHAEALASCSTCLRPS
ncbi:hypothetical protein NDU88_004603 [Pleurodeles waltl]|uniref:Uncharacterized protein n=1 Tax=Pleurodeles waltl TaxID=8319 RepID=A0AAV7M7L0_PLEWA|nr:hypothetical protein NDU88_004603 [Pleurodeles waltl]